MSNEIVSSETLKSTNVFIVTLDENEIMCEDLEETLIFVGQLLERLKETKAGKYIYVVEHILKDNGSYVKGENLFDKCYLIG
jgi:hypothetical protein